MNLAPVLFLMVGLAGQVAREATFESDLWPGERLFPERLVASCGEVGLRESPSERARVVRHVPVPKGSAINCEQTRYVTLEVGSFQALTGIKVRGRVLGAIRYLSKDAYYRGGYATKEIEVAAGTTIDYLQYRAEGSCFVRVQGDVIDAAMCPSHQEAFQMVKEPTVEKWALAAVGDVIGWVNVDGTCVNVIAWRK